MKAEILSAHLHVYSSMRSEQMSHWTLQHHWNLQRHCHVRLIWCVLYPRPQHNRSHPSMPMDVGERKREKGLLEKTSFEGGRECSHLLLYDCNACQLYQVSPDSNLVHSNLVMAADKRVPFSLAIEISSHLNVILIFCNVNGTNMIKLCYLDAQMNIITNLLITKLIPSFSAIPWTNLALLYFFIIVSPITRKVGRLFQHVFIAQEPLTPWHLHSVFNSVFTIWNAMGIR